MTGSSATTRVGFAASSRSKNSNSTPVALRESSLSITDHTALTMVTLSLDLNTIAQSHQPIVDAIAAGDIELACRVSREHQAWFEEMLAATAEKGSQRTSAVSA